MKKEMLSLVLSGGFAASVWFGFIEGVEGAQYLAKFWVWAVAVPLGLMALTEAIQKKLAAEPEQQRARAVKHMVQSLTWWFALVVFIWFGHIATAVALGFWMLAAAVCREGVKKHRAAPSAAPTT